MGRRAAAAVLPLVCGAAAAFHRYPSEPHEHAVGERLARVLQNADECERPRAATPQQTTLAPGYFSGVRIQPFFMWLDDEAKTCLPSSPQRKVKDAAAAAGASGISARDPLQYYAPQDVRSVQVFNRDNNTAFGPTFPVECAPEHVVDETKRAYIRGRLLPKVLRQLRALLAPRQPGSGGTTALGGNTRGWDDPSRALCNDPLTSGKCLLCKHQHFLFELPAPYQYPEADLLLFVTAQPDWSAAWSMVCGQGSDGRPTSMVLNLSPSELATAATVPLGLRKYQARVMQAVLHGLGLSSSLYPYWLNLSPPNLQIQAPYSTTPSDKVHILRTPAVRSWLQTVQFRCLGHPKGGAGTLEGAELEDGLDGEGRVLPYWEGRLFRGELMTLLPPIGADQSLETPVISGLTLAALEDTGWYEVNHNLAQPLQWLREQPCEVATQPCSQWPARYRCPDGAASLVCSTDFTSVAACNGVVWPAGEVPLKFRRYGSATRSVDWAGARELQDFCAFADAEQLSGASCLVAKAADPSCQSASCPEFQVRGPTSRCFLSTLSYKGYAAGAALMRGTCLPHTCTRIGTASAGQPQQWKVSVWVAGTEYVCDGSQAEVGPSEVNAENGTANCAGQRVVGRIRCPDVAELCGEAGTGADAACDPFEDCNAHGSCAADGSCRCFDQLDPSGAPLYGAWTGPRCTRCHEDYAGPECKDRRCPIDPQTLAPCYGNGVCTATGCACFDNATHGYWSNATSCLTCASGKTGGTCKLDTCDPDPSRNSCQQGTCDSTTLRCVCFSSLQQGFWMHGDNGVCSRCAPGYDYGQSCKARIANFYGCDTQSARDGTLDSIQAAECRVSCVPGDALPQRAMRQDAHGCYFSRPPAKCHLDPQRDGTQPGLIQCPHLVDAATNISVARAGAHSGCPSPTRVLYDCQGYPNLYADCWLKDECGCAAPARVDCVPGTDARASPDAFTSQIRAAGKGAAAGPADARTAASATSDRQCRCPKPRTVAQLDCWGFKVRSDNVPGGVSPFGPPYERGRVVLFEPRQKFQEDFCHCTSPPIPQCSDATKPQWLLVRKQGAALDCKKLLADYGCPDWAKILNIGQKTLPTSPDLSLIDCDGWPPPLLHSDKDPCGCPYPLYKCMPGTMGKCDSPPDCPQWEPMPAIDCLGQMPPVLNLHGDHPCGCPPPPRPTCLPGTERGEATAGRCLCDAQGSIVGDVSQQPVPCKLDDVEWVDCAGSPLEEEPWNPWAVYPLGDPWVNPCDPCPSCAPKPPLRRCLPGTSAPSPRSANAVAKVCPTFDRSQCRQQLPACPVDCHGRPRAPDIEYDPDCECPPQIPTPPCLPGTDGTAPNPEISPAACESAPRLCGAYACGGGGEDLEAIAADLDLTGDYSTAARDEVLASLGGTGETLVCVREGHCKSHYHCSAGFLCGVCGLCLPDNAQGVHGRGCLADGGASCGLFRCDIQCDREGIQKIMKGARDAECRSQCRTNEDCRQGSVCNIGVFSRPPRAGAAYLRKVRVLGKVPQEDVAEPPVGVAGINPLATAARLGLADEPTDFVPMREYGECVETEGDISSTMLCTSHDECGGYACGSTTAQYMFSLSRCLSSCWVNAHCHPDYRCDRSEGRCVAVRGEAAAAGRTLPDGPGCELQPTDHCSPYWCGGDRGADPHPASVCPSACEDDSACQPFYHCVIPTLAELKAEYGTDANDAACDPVTGVRTRAATRVSARSMATGAKVTRGRCVARDVLQRRGQTDHDLDEEQAKHPFLLDPRQFRTTPRTKELPMLVVPVGGHGGLQDDPNTVRLLHVPFEPPSPVPPRPEGTAVSQRPAECWPYTGAARGITAGQVKSMRANALAGAVDGNTGSHLQLPGCRTYCLADSDCVGGFYCVRPDKVPVYTSAGGRRVVARGSGKKESGDDAPGAELGEQGLDEDTEAMENRPGLPGVRRARKGTCQRKRGLGTACVAGWQCGSGHCSDGVCCNTECGLPCQTCARMGICGWAVPHGPGKGCPKCHWCEYTTGADGLIGPGSALACAEAAEGHDPRGDCGEHATCNGEGDCVAEFGWGGGGQTCAQGFSGPNCDVLSVNYRTIAVPATYTACSASTTARLSKSPAPFGYSAEPGGVRRRTAIGLGPQSTPSTSYLLRQRVVDRRPRQWAKRVLGLSAHSPYPCSDVLHDPSSPPSKRRHRLTNTAWAPRGYVKMPAEVPDLFPELQYFPYVNCPNLTTAACGSTAGCKWVQLSSYGFCVGDGTVTARPATVTTLQDKRTPDPATVPAPLPLEWIELEFDSPVFVETVIIHENYNPGSVVRIETQPAMVGSAALAATGGGAFRTDANGDVVQPTVVRASLRGGTESPTTACGNLTAVGRAVCISDPACFWQNGECRQGVGTCTLIDQDSCVTRERAGLCWWDESLLLCRSGRRPGCYGRAGYDPTQFSSLCGQYNDMLQWSVDSNRAFQCGQDQGGPAANATEGVQQCVWTDVSGVSVCNPITDGTGGCAKATTGGDCVSPCVWNGTASRCSEPPNGLTVDGASADALQYCRSFKSAALCGPLNHCQWDQRQTVPSCIAVRQDHCSGPLAIPQGASIRETCRRLSACDWVDADELPQLPANGSTTSAPGCPDVLASDYSNAASVQYVLRPDASYEVKLTCMPGFGSVGVSRCRPGGYPLQGSTQCSVLTCPTYQALPPLVAVGYTASAPFAARQQGSEVLFECTDGQTPVGTPPVCDNGRFVAQAPGMVCGAAPGNSSNGTAPAERRSSQKRVPHASSVQPKRPRARGADAAVPDHDYDGLGASLDDLRRRWEEGRRGLPDHHPHSRVFRVMQGTAGGATPAPTAPPGTGTSTSALRGYCRRDPLWEPDASIPAHVQYDWGALCGQQVTQLSCTSDDDGAPEDSPGRRAGKCEWLTVQSVDPATPIPAPPTTAAEMGSTGGAGPPLPFRLRDMGPLPDPSQPMPSKDQTAPTPTNVPCEDLAAGTTINPNPANFTTVWERSWPNFPVRRRYREWQVDVGATSHRAKAIRIYFAPTSGRLSQIDAVAIVGAQDRAPATYSGPACKGEIWVSPVRDGTPTSAAIRTATVVPVPCNGRGRCGPRGCECFGNFHGEGCDACKFGWTGPGCDKPIKLGCTEVAFEDLSQFDDADEVRARWQFQGYKQLTSAAVRWKHFGSKLSSPKYDLGDHTHIHLDVGSLLVDVPDSDDCGVMIGASEDRAGTGYQLIHTAGCEFFSGLNLIGTERGDKIGFFSVQRRWSAPTVVITVEVWWGGAATNEYVFTVLNLALRSCVWPDTSSS